VGPWDNQALVYCCAALKVVTGQLTTRLLEQPARSKAKTGQSKQQRLQGACAAHLRDIARAYPAQAYPEVVILIDNAPWHRGAMMEHVLAAYPNLRLYRWPRYSPQLHVIERLWRVLRRRATHNRLFASMAALRAT
jgi:DDE superfamily endonuclease